MTVNGRHIIIGTSGHIDHGKSALVKALTGTDPDRLQEEKVRGMTIDLGYAFYSEQVAFIDVPGHEKFIKNMVAGVTTIDFVLFVIAADDGVMPQTREHLDILQILGIERGIIAMNKIDLVEPAWLDLVEDEIRGLVKGTFLQRAPIIRVSATTKAGLAELRQEIDRRIQETPPRQDRGYFWLPVDRSFSIQGFGTVVTGSVLSGELRVGDEVDLLPTKRLLKVRGLQCHGKKSASVRIGDRAAVNLQGIHRDEIQRGTVLATPDYGKATRRLDARLQLLASSPWSLKDQDRLRLHIGTNEVFVRVRLLDRKELLPGENGLVQFYLESFIAANRKDRYVIRKYSPPVTLGGGIVLDNYPQQRHRRNDQDVLLHLQNLTAEAPDLLILDLLINCHRPCSLQEISQTVGLPVAQIEESLNELAKGKKVLKFQTGQQPTFFARDVWNVHLQRLLQIVECFNRENPHLPGISRAELSSQLGQKRDPVLYEALLHDLLSSGKLVTNGESLALPGFSSGLTAVQQEFYDKLLSYLSEFRFTPPYLKEVYQHFPEQKNGVDLLVAHGISHGELVVLPTGLIYQQSILTEAQHLISDFLSSHLTLSVAEFRDLIQASRKYAVAILEYFDEIGFTRREGDERVLND